jgi:hypothetical protein
MDGTTASALVSSSPMTDDRGRPRGLLAMVTDITERLAAEEALAAARVARKQASELNDNVVQGLVLAKYALAGKDVATAARMVDGTLGHARRMISDLIGGADVAPGDLRREQAAGVE